MNVKKIVSIAVLVIIVIVTSFGVMLVIFKEIGNPERAYAGGISLGLKDNNMSMIEEILTENLPVSYTTKKVDWIGPWDYTVIPSSEFNSLKETLLENESIEITAVKQEDGDIYALVHLLGESDRDATIKLQEHLDKYSLEVKEVNWMYVRFSKHVKNKETEHTINLLKNESNVIKASPDLVAG
jgi:hypothetical protein